MTISLNASDRNNWTSEHDVKSFVGNQRFRKYRTKVLWEFRPLTDSELISLRGPVALLEIRTMGKKVCKRERKKIV